MMRLCPFWWLRWMTIVLCCGLALPVPAAEPVKALEIGLVPNVSARALLTAFEPMRLHLEHELKVPVQLYSAQDFRTFFERTQRNEFDLVVTPAHFAWLAISEAGHVPLLTYKTGLRGLIVVAKSSAIDSAADLKGRIVGLVDPLAIVTMRGLQWLRERGLEVQRDFKTVRSAPHNTAALAVANGHIDAAIIGSGPYRIMAEELRGGLRVLTEVGEVPNAIYLVRGKLPAETRKAVRAALLSFGESAAGKHFMEDYRYEGFRPISVKELRGMEVYSRQVRSLLEAAPQK